MKTIKTLMMILLGTALVMPVLVSAAEFTGQVVGHSCTSHAKLCPLEGHEEHLAMGPDFVLVDESDGTYVYLHNLPRDLKVRHALKKVTVIGEMNETSNGIAVTEMVVDGKTVWSWEQQTKGAAHITASDLNNSFGQ